MRGISIDHTTGHSRRAASAAEQAAAPALLGKSTSTYLPAVTYLSYLYFYICMTYLASYVLALIVFHPLPCLTCLAFLVIFKLAINEGKEEKKQTNDTSTYKNHEHKIT